MLLLKQPNPQNNNAKIRLRFGTEFIEVEMQNEIQSPFGAQNP